VPAPGEIVDNKYLVKRVIGRGGMGEVLEATHLVLREPVAVKTLLPELASEPEAVERFIREARAVAKIRGPHVARVLDVGSLPSGIPYLVMEYLEGEDLGALLDREKKLPVARAVDIVLEACEAIAEAHAAGIVHRDLKPSNIFVSKAPSGDCVKVLDFGISKLSKLEGDELALTKTKTLLGSPLYMSPEQLRNTRAVDARADIWSLGIILFEAIGGRTPFEAANIAHLGALVLATDAPPLSSVAPEVPSDLSEAVATCLRRDPEERFVNIADFAVAIAPFGSGAARSSSERIVKTVPIPSVRARATKTVALAATMVQRPSQAPRPASVTSRTRTGALMAIVVVAVATIGLAALALRRQPAPTGVVATVIASESVAPSVDPPPFASTTALPPPTGDPRPTASVPPVRMVRVKPAPSISAPPPPAASTSTLACQPPFWFDAQGEKHWKRECL
jgi:serine/threonine-protein kinase